MVSLSLCMMVKDEGEYLEQCLNSVKEFVDEIVIVDTGSTDKTVEIAKRFTDKVFKHEWCDDFSKVRNISLGYATKEWVLVLDADEVIAKEDLGKIKELIKDSSVDGYRLIQRNYTNNSATVNWTSCFKESKYTKDFCGYETSRLTRLFRNNKGFEFRNRVHELVEYSIKKKGGKITDVGIFIHHYRELKPGEIKEEKRRKYFNLGEKQIKENPDDERAYYETGLVYVAQGEHEKAIEKFKKVIELKPNYRNIYYNLGNAYCKLKRFDEAERILKKSIEKKPELADAYNLLGIIYQSKKMYKEAIGVLSNGIKINKNVLLLQSLGGVFIKLGAFDKAVKVLNIALRIDPKNTGVLNNLGGAYIGLGKFNDAIKMLNYIIEIDKENLDAYKNLAVIYLRNNEGGKAIDILNRAVQIFPQHKESLMGMLEAVKRK